MDKETIFFTIFIILYVGNKIGANNLLNLLHIFKKFNIKSNKFMDFYNNMLNPFYFSEDEDEVNDKDGENLIKTQPTVEKPVLKYEDKFLDDIRKLEKEYIFTEEEKKVEQAKMIELLTHSFQDDCKKIEEFEDELNTIELKLTKYQNLLKDKEEKEQDKEEKEQDKDDDDFYIIIEDEDSYLGETVEEVIESLLKKKNINLLCGKAFDRLIVTEEYVNEKHNTLKELARKFIIDKRLDRLENCYIMESTPLGNVLMKYDKVKESFTYYSDNSIPYRYLEVVARKFVKQFNFRPIFVDMEEELKLTEEKWLKEKEKQEKEKEEKEKQEKEKQSTGTVVEKKKNVFAKFKSYNKESGTGHVPTAAPPKNSIPNKKITETQENEKILLKQRANRYTYEGKFANFKFLKKIDKKVVDKKLAMSFAEFKKTILNK